MKYLVLIAALLFSLPANAEADHYDFDKEHTYIMFHINHLGFSDTIGTMTSYDGSFMLDPKEPEKASVQIVFYPQGIRTNSPALDQHLQKEEFFNTTKFPTITFNSTKVTLTGKKTADVTGDLTLLGVTKPVTLKMRLNKIDIHPYSKKLVAGFSGETSFRRSDFGMDEYVPAVGDEVRITIETEGLNSRSTPPAVKH